MNYKPVIVGNQSNGSAGKTRVETVPDKDYILLPLWTQDLIFSSSTKDSPGAGYKPLREEEKKDTEDPRNKDSEAPIQKSRYNEVNVDGRKLSIELSYAPNMPELEDICIFEDSNEDVFGAEADLNNLESNFQVIPIPITRIHKDHPLQQVIEDLHSAPQTKRMSKNLEAHGLVSTFDQRTNYTDL
nr:hypothetical protein [Tanacetum cinerariifolium]